ncbi:MAG: DEAD/DEAH box helicase [Candidatus Aphodosoma sp.]
MTFQELGLRQEILDAVTELGFENPMPVQEQVIPYMLAHTNDLVALAQTGSGKTAAFGLPVLNLLDVAKRRIQALVLAPTRELCIQISNDLKKFAAKMPEVKIVPVYGGENIVNQFRQLDVQPHILVATPGRLIDLINRGKVNLSDVEYLILDEADEMLNMGFKDDLETILSSVPEQRRTLLFSATMPDEIARIAKKYMNDATEIAVGTRNAGADNVEHVYYMVQAANRYLALKRIVDVNPDIYAIVFCRTRQETKEVAEKLMRDGYNADALHGDLSQEQRDTVMNKFRIRHIQILVATDVAARGLDVSDLTHVINYNLPDDVEVYTHRSGRTGRAGKKGISCVIVHTREGRRLREIERVIKKEFKRERVPTGMDVCKRQLFHLIDRMERVEVNNEQISQFMEQIMAKLSYLGKEEIISRFVSLEFNRFLDYYRDAEDINVDTKLTKRGDSEEERNRKKKNGGRKVRLKMLYGSRQNASPKSVLSRINSVTQDKSISIGDIEITNKFTFFDVYADQVDQVLKAFEADGQPLAIAEPREVSSHAPRRDKASDRNGYSSRERGERRDGQRNFQNGNSGYKRNDRSDSYGRKGARQDKFSTDDWRNLMDGGEPENSGKPWRNRRR